MSAKLAIGKWVGCMWSLYLRFVYWFSCAMYWHCYICRILTLPSKAVFNHPLGSFSLLMTSNCQRPWQALSFMFEYIGEMAKDYIYAVTPLLEDALMDRDLVHRQARNISFWLPIGPVSPNSNHSHCLVCPLSDDFTSYVRRYHLLQRYYTASTLPPLTCLRIL